MKKTKHYRTSLKSRFKMAVNEEFWQTLDTFRATILCDDDLPAAAAAATDHTDNDDHSR